MPALVGLPRNHSAEPPNAGRAVIIGMYERAPWLPAMTRPWAVSGSALTTSMLTRAPDSTTSLGLTSPAILKVSSGPPAGLARTANRTLLVVNVIEFAARLTRAPAGIWPPNLVTRAGLTRGPGALAQNRPMTLPGSVLVPIM